MVSCAHFSTDIHIAYVGAFYIYFILYFFFFFSLEIDLYLMYIIDMGGCVQCDCDSILLVL